MRLSYEVENDRREIILESDPQDHTRDVNDWSVLFQWAADFERASKGDEEATMTTLFGDDKIISISPMEKLKSFKAGQLDERGRVVAYLQEQVQYLASHDFEMNSDLLRALADDITNGLHIDPA